MNNNQTENIKNELKRIAAKQTLGLPLTTHESAMLTLYGNTDAATAADNTDAGWRNDCIVTSGTKSTIC